MFTIDFSDSVLSMHFGNDNSNPELHQLTSPRTAPAFLNSLLSAALESGKAVNDLGLYAEFIAKGWAGMLKGRGFN